MSEVTRGAGAFVSGAELGLLFASLRRDYKLSQREFAGLNGMYHTTLMDIEMGRLPFSVPVEDIERWVRETHELKQRLSPQNEDRF